MYVALFTMGIWLTYREGEREMVAENEELKYRYIYRGITWKLRCHSLLVNHKEM